METEEIIVYFESVTQAILAEQILTERKLDVRVMPTPADISPGCGFCLRFPRETFEKAGTFLSELGLPIKAIYQKEPSGSYKKIQKEKP
ncbi:MAG: DUF3343 domain-containing protein [Spirochaetaceae bacterium]|jgi:hypothetical protein|nr:DUF3343 domain-containing protein [Spirochaetaceae bacterium]